MYRPGPEDQSPLGLQVSSETSGSWELPGGVKNPGHHRQNSAHRVPLGSQSGSRPLAPPSRILLASSVRKAGVLKLELWLGNRGAFFLCYGWTNWPREDSALSVS